MASHRLTMRSISLPPRLTSSSTRSPTSRLVLLTRPLTRPPRKGLRHSVERIQGARQKRAGRIVERAFDNTLDALDLKFDRATFTQNTAGALAALDQTEAAIRKRIATEGRTTELLRLLFQVDQDRAA